MFIRQLEPYPFLNTPYFFYKQPIISAEPGKEIEITTSKLTTMCLKNQQFQPMCAYKLRAYKKNKVYIDQTPWFSGIRSDALEFRRMLHLCMCGFFARGLPSRYILAEKRMSLRPFRFAKLFYLNGESILASSRSNVELYTPHLPKKLGLSTLYFFYKDQQKKSEPGKEIEIATNKITTMSLNIGYF